MNHSQSSCKVYETCPRRFRYAFIDKFLPERPVPPTWRHGTAIHRALQTAYRSVMAGIPVATTFPLALRTLNEAWVELDLPDVDGWHSKSISVLNRTLQHNVLPLDEILGVEMSFQDEIEGFKLSGVADLVLRINPDVIEIVDHKVTRTPQTPADLLADHQLNLYAWFAKRQWLDTKIIRGTHHYPVLGTTVTVELTEESIARVISSIIDTARTASQDSTFEPRPSGACEHCQWIDRCPAVDAKLATSLR